MSAKGVARILAIVLSSAMAPAVAQERPAGGEALDFAYTQLGTAINAVVQRQMGENAKLRAEVAAQEARKATLIEWLKAAQEHK